MKLSTSRLTLRPFEAEDWKPLFAYLSDPDVVLYEPYDVYTEEGAQQEAKNRAKNKDFIAVCLQDTDRLIGNLYFSKREFDTYELGYVFAKEYQHKGYATEASTALLNYAFSTLGIHRVVALCNPENKASWRLMKRLHMRREGRFRQCAYFKNDPATGEPLWHDAYQYAILKEDWLKLQ